MTNYPVIRDLDGAYFRVMRDGKWHGLCFSDLTREEQEWVVEGYDMGWLRSMVFILADTIRNIGDSLDIKRGE